jgi:hypothetical protein
VLGVVDDLQSLILMHPVNAFRLGSMGGVEVVRRVYGSGFQDIPGDGTEGNELLSMLRGPLKASYSRGGESELADESFNHLSSLYHQLKKINASGSSSEDTSTDLISKAIAIAKSIGSLFEGSDQKSNQGDGKDASNEQAGSIVASTLFMRAIESFSGTPKDSRSSGSAAMDKSQSGIVLLALQSHIPIHVMLANGISIMQLIRSILKVLIFVS